MQNLNTLWQVLNAANSVRELSTSTQTYRFGVTAATTFYLQAEGVAVEITRWAQPMIEVTMRLQAAFGWRVASDQDEAGVYVVARRRTLVGGLSGGSFEVFVPYNTYLILKLTDGRVQLENVNGTLNLPPNT